MSKKLKKGLAAVVFLLVSAAVVIFALEKVSLGKLDGFSSKATSLIKERFGISTELSGLDVSFFPPRVFIKKAAFSHGETILAGFEQCFLYDIEKMVFANEKKVKVKCAKSRFYTDPAVKYAVSAKQNASAGKKNGGEGDKFNGFSLRFESESEFVFKDIERKFQMELDLTQSGGKAVFKEPGKERGTAEVIFLPGEKSASIRLDGLDLSDFREIIRGKTSLDILSGEISAVSEIKIADEKILSKNDFTLKNLSFFHALIDSKPFSLPLFRFVGDITFNKNEKSVATKDAEVSLGGINAVLSGSYSKEKKDFSIKTESAKLNKLETLIHNETFEGYLFGGTLELLAEYSQEGEEPPVFSVVGNLVDPQQLSERLEYLKTTFDYVRTENDGEKKTIVVGERNPDFTPISIIPDHLIWAVVVSEDAGFFIHKGVDFQELDAAVKDNIKTHRMRGGSTITQQLAKNLFLSSDKTLLRKFREVLLSIELDAALSKERLLEIYFNIIEWAPGIFGISQAAYYYFGKTPFELTPLESAYLASVIPGPAKYHFMFLNNNVTENWYKSLCRILNIMNETGHLSTDDYFEALKQEIVFRETGEE